MILFQTTIIKNYFEINFSTVKVIEFSIKKPNKQQNYLNLTLRNENVEKVDSN